MNSGKNEMKCMKASLIAHVVVIFALVIFGLVPGISCMSRPKDTTIPIEFTVDTSSLEEEAEQEDIKEPDSPPDKDAVSVPDKKPEVKKPEEKKPEPAKPKRPEIKKSTKIVKKDRNTPKKPMLSKKEIEKLLAMGAKAGDHTSVPNDDQIGLLAIKNALYTAWIRPTAEFKAASPAMIEIRIDKFGNVISRRLTSPSGSPVLDKSVLDAAGAVQRIQNLPPGFTKRFPSVVIEFELK